MVKTIVFFFTILISYFPKKSPSILNSFTCRATLEFHVVIFKLLLKGSDKHANIGTLNVHELF